MTLRSSLSYYYLILTYIQTHNIRAPIIFKKHITRPKNALGAENQITRFILSCMIPHLNSFFTVH